MWPRLIFDRQPQARQRRGWLVLTLTVVAAMLAACSSSPASGGGTPSKGGTVSVAVVGPDTGASAAIGPAINAPVLAAIHVIDAAGGVLGEQLKGHIVDDTGDPADAVPNVEKAIATIPNLDMAMGIDSNVAATVVPLFNRAQIPMQSLNGLSLFIHNKYPYFYRITSPDVALGSSLGIFAKKLHFTRPAVITENDSGDMGNQPGALYALHKEGITPVENVTVPGDQTSYLSTVSSTISKKPDALIISADTQTTATLLSEYKSLHNGIVPPMLSSTENLGETFFKALQTSAGASYATSKVYLCGSYVPTNTEAYRAYMNAISATASENPGGKALPQAIAQTVGALYDGTIMLALAMDMAHSTKGSVYNKDVVKVATPGPGIQVVHTYAAGQAALKSGKRIDYVGVDVQAHFNKYHISDDDFGVYGLTSTGNTSVVKAIVGGPSLAAYVPSQ